MYFSCLNRVELIGYISKRLERKVIPSTNTPACNLTLATVVYTRMASGKEYRDAQYHNVVIYGNKNLTDRLKLKDRIMVIGKLRTRIYTKQGMRIPNMEIVAQQLAFLPKDRGYNSNKSAEDERLEQFELDEGELEEIPFEEIVNE